MRSRRHGTKPTLALWMLVAVADFAILVATAGLLTDLLVVAGLVTVAAAFAGVRLLHRRDAPEPKAVVHRRT
jgi:Ni,Fe-hydrogenase III small subunit